MVVWTTGLAGAGKTTIASEVYKKLKQKKDNVVYLDGDQLRMVLDATGYTYEERLSQAKKVSGMCKMLEEQGIDVVCATIGLFREIQELNRMQFEDYIEVYLKVDMDVLKERDQKGLYSGALSGEVKNVVGIDVAFEEPQRPDLTIENNTCDKLEEKVNKIIELIV